MRQAEVTRNTLETQISVRVNLDGTGQARLNTGIGFFDPANPKRLLPRLRRLVARIGLEAEEVRILRGVLRTVAVLQGSKNASPEGLKDPSKSIASP